MFSRPTLLASLLAAGIGALAWHAHAGGEPGKQAVKKTGDELTHARFDALHALIKPDPKNSFESVPWLTSLWSARQKAAAEDKPIVLWAGDPLPLGIT